MAVMGRVLNLQLLQNEDGLCMWATTQPTEPSVALRDYRVKALLKRNLGHVLAIKHIL